ncbi:MAG: AI-2E family transporter, partial [Gammaproteobacteria bacterium]
LIAFMVVFVLFLAVLVLTMFGLLPILSKQLTQFVQLAPAIVAKGQSLLMQLPQHYPEVFTADQVNNLVAGIHTEIAGLGQDVVSLSLNTVLDIVTVGVYLVLMPIMVFFFLKDKHKIQQWVTGYLPKRRDVANEVWTEMDLQLGNYVRGKSWEFLVMWVVDYIAFVILDLRFAMLLSVLVGISVIVPYIGMVAVTIPVVLVAYFQWGLTSDFYTLLIVFFIIQAIDGNVLVPLLFSEVVNIHPIGIIVAILVFGGIWGMWGVFFAIPLATLIKSLLNAWPTLPDPDEAGSPT